MPWIRPLLACRLTGPTTRGFVRSGSLSISRRKSGRIFAPSSSVGIFTPKSVRMIRPNAVTRWLEGSALEDDEWVESIPYEQTRAYAKRVLRSLNAYRILY